MKLSGIGLHIGFLTLEFDWCSSNLTSGTSPSRHFLEKVILADEIACLLGKSLVEIGFLLQVFVLIDVVEDEARCWSTSSLVTIRCIAHEFGQIRLEDLLRRFPRLIELFLLLLNLQEFDFCLRRIWTKMLNSKSIKAEHPLIHLEFFDVELAHELDDFDSLERQVVLLCLLFARPVHVRRFLGSNLQHVILRQFKYLHDLGKQVRPEALENLIKLA